MYQIVETSPLYCAITDGLIGSTSRLALDGMTFETEAWARAKAGLMEQDDYENCGDRSYRVIRAGDPLRRPYVPMLRVADDYDMPF